MSKDDFNYQRILAMEARIKELENIAKKALNLVQECTKNFDKIVEILNK